MIKLPSKFSPKMAAGFVTAILTWSLVSCGGHERIDPGSNELLADTPSSTGKVPPFPARISILSTSASKPGVQRDEEEYTDSWVWNFHPFGWSEDGKAAYLRWRENEHYTDMTVIVYDAVRDTVAASWHEQFSDTSLSEEQIEEMYRTKGEFIAPLLKDFGIRVPEPLFYSDFPVIYTRGGDTIKVTATFSTHISPIDNRYMDSLNVRLTFTLSSEVKTIQMGWGGFFDIEVVPAGIWMSPDKKYGLLASYFLSPGQHGGAPHDIGFEFKAIEIFK